MPDIRLAACLLVVVLLVVASAVGFVWSHRNDDPLGSVIGLGTLMLAGVPAAAYAAMTAF